ncbi:mismatch repair endonuclease PMS2 [Phlebotomus argentipes]|uniref:mismatch repair endonuclease PMS2 n=1 Tax=Phlebotomus argentipes TaxID=94469 RepID=UPI0028934F96|nr:mismatch repair endonuclease PMS2 [Phlebotomus argentipes]
MDSQENTSAEVMSADTTEIAKEIKPIDKISVHRICSGQVILCLASAVKELVENSLDAKATLIEVKLKDQGLESVEVSDNGIGVEKTNFKGLVAKYHTSKIRDFKDLEQVATFGFRGEALSSLCGLSDMVIITKHHSAVCGTRLEFDNRGDITGELPCARQTGTTVQLRNLFGLLPVRKAEFRRNVKKEFTKMCTILQSYCLSATGVKIICTNITQKGSKTTIFHTEGGKSVIDNIRNVFGAKQVADLVAIKPPLERDDRFSQETFQELDLADVSTDDLQNLNVAQFTINGWISSCAHGSGRSSRDRQFIYVNSRPCDLKKIITMVNEIYHKYNVYQFPFVYLDIRMENSRVDVNVTPDKRQLFIGNENILLLALKIALLRTFNECASTYKIEKPEKSLKVVPKKSEKAEEEDVFLPSSQEKFTKKLSQWKATGNTDDQEWHEKRGKRKIMDELEVRKAKMKKMQATLEAPEPERKTRISCGSTPKRDVIFEAVTPKAAEPVKSPKRRDVLEDKVIDVDSVAKSHSSRAKIRQMSQKLSISMAEIRAKCQQEAQARKEAGQVDNLKRLKFKAKLDPNINDAAEEELSREIDKNSFSSMKIIGQFNRSFIIARLDDDLFIVDQHATDEKYNFEQLQATEKIQSQPLVIPQSLELSAVKELQLMDNLDVFQRNGFHFAIDREAPTTKRIKLVQKPQSRNWDFGVQDIEELLFMLEDAPAGVTCRPSRVRAMFASRACRKSVMFGMALKRSDMRRLLDHMGQIKHPWHCPHGRPTMRHLLNLSMIGD